MQFRCQGQKRSNVNVGVEAKTVYVSVERQFSTYTIQTNHQQIDIHVEHSLQSLDDYSTHLEVTTR
jgi:hypothetical protein